MQLGVFPCSIHSPAHLASHQHLSPRIFLRRPQPNRRSISQSHGASHEAATSNSSSVPTNVEQISYQIRQPIGDLARTQQAVSPAPFTAASAVTQLTSPATLGIAGAVLLAGLGIKYVFDTPSRTYNQNVGQEYDAWTQEGLLEYFWGEHIHLGYYTEEERKAGYKKKDFKQAKFDFVDEMYKWSRAEDPKSMLDVGCGIGGTSRHLAAKRPGMKVEGITLSPAQVKRATELAKERGLDNVHFQVMDALEMSWPDDSFDLVWACESGEHMPDKKKYVEEMVRVLKPGGSLVIACWCQREEGNVPFTDEDRADLQFLYDEWAHPFFISKEEFGRLAQGTGKMEAVETADWTPQTLPTWRHSNWVGVWDPWPVIFKWNPKVWYMVCREIVTIERMHRAFDKGLMEYGMIRATKALPAFQRASAADRS